VSLDTTGVAPSSPKDDDMGEKRFNKEVQVWRSLWF
jgi:hypothetical protein